jgi:dsDNA-specific endonuclease/ATPase MutS2
MDNSFKELMTSVDELLQAKDNLNDQWLKLSPKLKAESRDELVTKLIKANDAIKELEAHLGDTIHYLKANSEID